MVSCVERVTVAAWALCCARLEMFESTTVSPSESMADRVQEGVGYKELLF